MVVCPGQDITPGTTQPTAGDGKRTRRPYQASRTVTPGTDDRKERYLAPFAFIELLKIFGSLCQRLNCLCAAGLESRLPAHSFSITVARCCLPSPLPTAPSSTSLSLRLFPSLSVSFTFPHCYRRRRRRRHSQRANQSRNSYQTEILLKRPLHAMVSFLRLGRQQRADHRSLAESLSIRRLGHMAIERTGLKE